MSNYSLILKLIADDKDFKQGFDSATKILDRHVQKVKDTGNSYANMNKTLENLKSVARNAFLEFGGAGSTQFKKATEAAKSYQSEIQRVNKEMEKQGLAGKGGDMSGNSLANSIVGVAIKRIIPLMILNKIGTALMDTTKMIMDFNRQMSILQAISGEASNKMRDFSESAIRIAAVTPVTTSEVVQLQIELAKLGLTRVQILAATEAVVDMAIVGMVPLGEAATVAASTMKAFGLRAGDMLRIADVMAMSFNKSAMDMQKYSDSVGIAAIAAKSAGFTMEFTVSALSRLVDLGMDASTAGTSLRNIFLELAVSGKDFGQVMGSIKNASDQNSQAMQYFEKRTAVAAIALANSTDELNDLNMAMYESQGTTAKAADIIENNMTGAVKELGGAFEAMTIRIAQSQVGMGKFITGTVNSLSNLVRAFDAIAAGANGRATMRGQETFYNAKDEAALRTQAIKDSALDEIKGVQDAMTKEYITVKQGQAAILAIQEQSYQDQADATITYYNHEVDIWQRLYDKKVAEVKKLSGLSPEELLASNDFSNRTPALEAMQYLETLRLLKAEISSINEERVQKKLQSLMLALEGGEVKKPPESSVKYDKQNYVRSLTGDIEKLEKRISIATELMNQDQGADKLEAWREHLRNLNAELDMLKGDSGVQALAIAPELLLQNQLDGIAMSEADRLLEDFVNRRQSHFVQLSQMTTDFALQMGAGFIADIFEKAANSDSTALDNYGWKVLGSMGQFLQNMGSMIVAYGMAEAAFLTADPFTKIAAGLTMIAIGAAMSGYSKGKLGAISGTGSGGFGGVPQFSPMEGYSKYAASGVNGRGSGSGTSGSQNEIEFKIKGDDLVAVLRRNELKQSSLY